MIKYAIPCHNNGSYLPEALESVERDISAGGFKPSEAGAIVLDDGSTDQTAAVIQDYKKNASIPVINLSKPSPSGEGGARATLLSASNSTGADYYRFIDADDRIIPGSTARLIECVRASGLIAASGHCTQFDTNGTRPQSTLPLDDEAIRGSFRKRNAFPTAYALFDGKKMRDTGVTVDTKRQVTADYELFIRLLEKGRLANLPDAVAEYRRHPDSITAKKLTQVRAAFLKISMENWQNPALPKADFSDYAGIAKVAVLLATPKSLHPYLVKLKHSLKS